MFLMFFYLLINVFNRTKNVPIKLDFESYLCAKESHEYYSSVVDIICVA